MKSTIDALTSRLSGLVASVCSQLRVAWSVGLPSDGDAQTDDAPTFCDSVRAGQQEIRSMDDYAGYLTTNGLGSLDIGGGRSRWGE
jgi:hypothetical protein